MPRAIVLVNADVGKEPEVYSSIKDIPEVIEVHTSYGTYDIIAIVNAETNERLKSIITTRIQVDSVDSLYAEHASRRLDLIS